jgi:hypothetical protein
LPDCAVVDPKPLLDLIVRYARVDDNGRLVNDDVALLYDPSMRSPSEADSSTVESADDDEDDDNRAGDIDDDTDDTMAAARAAAVASMSDAAEPDADDDEGDDDGYLREFAAMYGEHRTTPSKATRRRAPVVNADAEIASRQLAAATSSDLEQFEQLALARHAIRRLLCVWRCVSREMQQCVSARPDVLAEVLPDAAAQFGMLTEQIQIRATLALDEMHRRGVCVDLCQLRRLQRACVRTHADALRALIAVPAFAAVFDAKSLADALAAVADCSAHADDDDGDGSSAQGSDVDLARVRRPDVNASALRAYLLLVVDEVPHARV